MGTLTGGGRNGNVSPSSEDNENISQSTKVRSGRSQGSKNFAEDEITALVALVHELKPAGADEREKLGLDLCARGREPGQSWPFSTGPSCYSRFDKLIPKQKQTRFTVILKIVQDALNKHLFTGSVVDNIHKEMVIEGVQEEWELEAGSHLKQELLVTPPSKKSKRNVSTIFKEGVEWIRKSERESQERQLLIFKDIVQSFSESMKPMQGTTERLLQAVVPPAPQ